MTHFRFRVCCDYVLFSWAVVQSGSQRGHVACHLAHWAVCVGLGAVRVGGLGGALDPQCVDGQWLC